jgi:hypothetical protein
MLASCVKVAVAERVSVEEDVKMTLDNRRAVEKSRVRHCADGGASRHANYSPRGDRSDKDKGKKGIVLQKSLF